MTAVVAQDLYHPYNWIIALLTLMLVLALSINRNTRQKLGSKSVQFMLQILSKIIPVVDTYLWLKANGQSHEFHKRVVDEMARVEKLKHQRSMELLNTRNNNSNNNNNDCQDEEKKEEGEYCNETLDLSSTSDDRHPLNIFCLDGGGSKGYALSEMGEAIEELCEELFGGDFLSRFDLVAGTSVGGIAALTCAHSRSTRECIKTCQINMNYVSQKIFTDFSIPRLIATGCGLKRSNDMRGISKILHNEKYLLQHDNGIKCFALSTICDDITINDNHDGTGANVQPFLLRSYNHPLEDKEGIRHGIDKGDENSPFLNGTSQLKVWEAMAATSAIPGGFDRVKVNINGQSRLLADGSVCCNCPLPIALKEAQSIWPNRPIGVVLSFGLDSLQDPYAEAAIESVRLNHPQLHYERIMIPQVHEFDCIETDKDKIKEIEECVRNYMRTEDMRMRMTSLLKQIFKGTCRRRNDSVGTS